MKELSTQEKAKRYDVVVNEIKNLRDILLKEGVINENGIICDNFNRIFPELKESEDERIKEDLIQWINEFPDTIWRGHYKKDVIAWLEKQIEQKEIDYKEEIKKCKDNPLYFFDKYVKVKLKENKFKVGDKIQYLKGCGTIMTIEKIENGEYIFANNMGQISIEEGNKWSLVEHNSAWSDDDDYYIERLFCLLNNEQDNYPQPSCDFQEIQEIKKWLETLKGRYAWKPSEKQMDVLLSEVTAWTKGCPKQIVLESLYNDLKKLKVDANMPIVCSV